MRQRTVRWTTWFAGRQIVQHSVHFARRPRLGQLLFSARETLDKARPWIAHVFRVGAADTVRFPLTGAVGTLSSRRKSRFSPPHAVEQGIALAVLKKLEPSRTRPCSATFGRAALDAILCFSARQTHEPLGAGPSCVLPQSGSGEFSRSHQKSACGKELDVRQKNAL
jgi:hypothetical protein